MIENFDITMVNWSRAQFALTAMYHWLFVPLIIGLAFIVALMETIYYKTGKNEWKRMTKFWMKLFGINFAIGVATGIILEFEFGTNWSTYSWFVGDIFGAPLAIEAILAFFLEATFVAVMFFGWEKVSKRFHLLSTWLVAIGAGISALWILVANAWMQNPVGMTFNPETARNEMINFWEVLFNPVAVNKFLHSISSGLLHGSLFVVGISCWFLLKRRETLFARKSILVGAVTGLLASLMVAYTGDSSARIISKVQPVKFAAFEALYEGKEDAGLAAFGILSDSEKKIGETTVKDLNFRFEIPGLLSLMTTGQREGFVPGIMDLVNGNSGRQIMSFDEKKARGEIGRKVLMDYKKARKDNNKENIEANLSKFRDENFLNDYFRYFGYSFVESPDDIIPSVPIAFYSFHLMVYLGFLFILIFSLANIFLFNGTIAEKKWFLWIAVLSIPLPYVSGEAGWVLTEMGRQPWIIQDLMTVNSGASQIGSGSVITTFILFAVLFTVLLIAEISIMIRQIKIGPKN